MGLMKNEMVVKMMNV